jgi:hypothetical protein
MLIFNGGLCALISGSEITYVLFFWFFINILSDIAIYLSINLYKSKLFKSTCQFIWKINYHLEHVRSFFASAGLIYTSIYFR